MGGEAKRRAAEINKLKDTPKAAPLKRVTGKYPAGQVFHFKDPKARAAALKHCPELAGKLDDSAAVTEFVKNGRIPHAMVRAVNVTANIQMAMPRNSVRPKIGDVLVRRIEQQKIKALVEAKERAES
jgi:hypothetical protein